MGGGRACNFREAQVTGTMRRSRMPFPINQLYNSTLALSVCVSSPAPHYSVLWQSCHRNWHLTLCTKKIPFLSFAFTILSILFFFSEKN